MKKALFIFLLILSKDYFGQIPPTDPNWNLIFFDDFNGPSLDTSKWYACNHFDAQDVALYMDNPINVYLNNGNLGLRIINQNTSCPIGAPGCGSPSYSYTSGRVETKHLFIQYGYVEARVAISSDLKQLFPAFWLFTGNFPNVPWNEIDIFEMTPGKSQAFPNAGNPFGTQLHTKNMMTTNYHTAPSSLTGPTDDPNSENMASIAVNDYTNFHIYAVEWSPTFIVWYLDGQVIRKATNHSVDDVPVKIIFNVALADIYQNGTYPPVISETMLVDYVKVYQLKKDCNNYVNSYLYNFPSYDNKVKNFINIGGQGSNNVVPAGSTTHLRASDHIEIDGEFEVPLNTTFFMQASSDCGVALTPNNCNNTFNPCGYNFNTYDNTTKQLISLGDFCPILINNNSIMLDFKAVDEVRLKNEVRLIPTNTNNLELKITSCP